jgi:hypothetical protein
VRLAIAGFGTFKAAGEDGIFPGLLQHGIEIIIGHITKKICCIFGVWLHTAVRVTFIHKPGSYELAKSFRPISLTSFFLKTMARLVDSYIRAGPLKSFRLWNHSMHTREADPLRLLFTILFKRLRGA